MKNTAKNTRVDDCSSGRSCIFESCTKSNFYVKRFSDTETNLQAGRTGESPAVISMLDIDLVHSDPALFVSSNSNIMCAKKNHKGSSEAYKRPFYLYVLRDPLTREIRYVGITNNPRKRERDHRTSFAQDVELSNPGMFQWKTILKRENAYPLFELIKKFPDYYSAHSMEVKIIVSLGDKVLNINHNPKEVNPNCHV